MGQILEMRNMRCQRTRGQPDLVISIVYMTGALYCTN